MKRTRLMIVGGAIAALALVAWLVGGGGTPVETVQVRYGDIIRTVEDSGVVQAVDTLELYTAQAAQVEQVAVSVGEQVKAGQTLVVLNSPDLAVRIDETKASLLQAQAAGDSGKAALERTRLQLQSAQDDLERSLALYQEGGISRAELEKVQLTYDTLKQNLSEQESALSGIQAQVAGLSNILEQLEENQRQLIITSPRDGIVLSLPVKAENIVSPGSLIATVGNPEKLEVKADILSDDLREVKVGQKANITAPYLEDKSIEGRIQKIYPAAEEKLSALGVIQRRVPVIISLTGSSELKPGFEVDVAIVTAVRTHIINIPRSAVLTLPDGRQQVMKVEKGRIKRQIIETGVNDKDNVEVVQGLKEGDVLVRDGSMDLPDNTRIKAQ